ncbi:hypothetical protein ACKUFM_25080, partial [Escherichia coli]
TVIGDGCQIMIDSNAKLRSIQMPFCNDKLQDDCFSMIRFLSDSGFSGSESGSVNKRSDLFCR